MAQKLKLSDYHSLAAKRGFEWVGTELPLTSVKTNWRCSNGHGCPLCVNMINGRRASLPQIELAELVGGEINYSVGRFSIDVAFPDEYIGLEYDSWYWHESKLDHDQKRDQHLIGLGWRFIRIKSNTQLPPLPDIHTALARLRAGETYIEIILPDWGE